MTTSHPPMPCRRTEQPRPGRHGMMGAVRLVVPLVAFALLLAGCDSGPDNETAAGDADGLWLLTTLEFDDELLPLDEPLFLEVDGTEVGGDTVCNRFGGQFGRRDHTATAEGCEPDDDPTIDRHEVQDAMIAAVLAGPRISDGRLTFTTSSTRLVYERIDDPTAVQLFAVLDDETAAASTDEIFLDPEAGRHPDYEGLARLTHPGTAARFYIGVDGELVCFIMSTDRASSSSCQRPRLAARRSWAFELANRDGPVGVHAALIPDAFVEAVAARPDLGQISGNVLLVAEGTAAGRYRFEEPGGQRFTLEVIGLP